jgi:hypothetical protein
MKMYRVMGFDQYPSFGRGGSRFGPSRRSSTAAGDAQVFHVKKFLTGSGARPDAPAPRSHSPGV